MDVAESFPAARAIVPQGGGASDKEYWLYHGEAIAKVGDTPPWPERGIAVGQGREDETPSLLRPDRPRRSTATPRYGTARRRTPAQSETRPTLRRPTESRKSWAGNRFAWRVSRPIPTASIPLSLLPDGRLYGTGDDYVGTFLFDPATDKTTYLGPRTGLAPYTTIVSGGKLYLSGYSGGHLFVFDPARDWTLGKGGPPGDPAPDQADARSNPRYLGDFDRTTRVGLMHSSALGADGKLYFGGFGLRHYTGGGLGWYDPKTRKMDGLWKPLSGYSVHWIAPALGGRLIVISTVTAADELNDNQAPDEARLFVFDVAEGKIVREIVPVAKGRTTGLVTEVEPGRLLGLTTDREHPDRSILYGVDVATGEVLFRKSLPSPVSTDAYWPHWVDPSYEYASLTRGPDGFVWTYLKDVLVRIDPKDASVSHRGQDRPGRLPDVRWKGCLLIRIRAIAADSQRGSGLLVPRPN